MEIFEFIKLSNQDKASAILFIMKIIISSILAIVFYKFLGGNIYLPKEINVSVILNFVISYEIFIPIIVISIVTAIFYFVLPNILKLITYLLVLCLVKMIDSTLAQKTSSSIILRSIKFISRHFLKITTIQLPEQSTINELLVSPQLKELTANSIRQNYGILVLILQLTLSYFLLFQSKYIFVGFVDTICQFVLLLSIGTVYFSIIRNTFYFNFPKQINEIVRNISQSLQ